MDARPVEEVLVTGGGAASAKDIQRHVLGRRGPAFLQGVIVYHGTTIECLEGIERDGLRPGTFVSEDRALARQYSWLRATTLGADSCVLFELDVPDSAVVEAESWWWARSQLMLPFGCPPSCILSIDHTDPEPFCVE